MSSKFAGLAIETEKTARMPIRHPKTNLPLRTKDGVEGYIEGHSADSSAGVRLKRQVTNGRLAMRNRSKLTSERLETETIEILAGLVTGWLLCDLEGNVIDVPVNVQNATDLLSDPGMVWLREQWDEFTSDRGNF